jgi:hypothetical protein
MLMRLPTCPSSGCRPTHLLHPTPYAGHTTPLPSPNAAPQPTPNKEEEGGRIEEEKEKKKKGKKLRKCINSDYLGFTFSIVFMYYSIE